MNKPHTKIDQYQMLANLLIKHRLFEVIQPTRLGEESTGRSASQEDAEAFARDLEQMGPVFIKFGQILSVRADLLSKPYRVALSSLHDDIGSVDSDYITQTIEEELGVRISQAFGSFETEPLATASLGQVHRATMRDGREVVVKVQRPDIRERIDIELEMLSELAGALDRFTDIGAQMKFVELIEEQRATLYRELDYRREASNLRRFGEIYADEPDICVPQPIPDFCTARVLTMEYIDGRKVDAHAPLRALDLQTTRLARTLFHAYLEQVFEHGLVHADPHPGNVLITRDGRIVLLDLGMVHTLSQDRQIDMLHLVNALVDENIPGLVELSQTIGVPEADFDLAAFRRETIALVQSFRELPPEEVQIGRMMMEVLRISHNVGLRMPPELSMLARAFMGLDQALLELDPSFDTRRVLKEEEERLIAHVVRQEQTIAWSRTLDNLKKLASEIPVEGRRFIKTLNGGDLKVRVQVEDKDDLMTSIEKIANRVTTGIIIAAVIIGAAMLMHIETASTLFGYPTLAIVFFLLAAVAGMVLVISSIWQDLR